MHVGANDHSPDLETAQKFLGAVKLFALAESLGGVESLIEHPALMTHASVPPEIRKELGISDTLIRISVGIEDMEDLIEDLEQALEKVSCDHLVAYLNEQRIKNKDSLCRQGLSFMV